MQEHFTSSRDSIREGNTLPHKKLAPPLPPVCSKKMQRPPQHDTGWLLCKGDDNLSILIRKELSPDTLEHKCLQLLAKSLPAYIEEFGADAMHSYLSTRPSHTLSALSIESCRQCTMNETIAYVLGHHVHVERLAISTKDTNLDLTNVLHPSGSLRRLELFKVHLEANFLKGVIPIYCPLLTHLSVRNCSLFNRDVLLNTLSTTIQVLDLSENDWVTDKWLVDFLKKHCKHLLYVNVMGCPFVSRKLLKRLDFEFRGRPMICTRRQSVARESY